METTEKRRPRGSGSIFKQAGSRFLWIAYRDANGKLLRESSGSEKPTDAQKLLRDRMGKADTGNAVTSEIRRITVETLYEGLLAEYKKENQDVGWAKGRWTTHLESFFSSMRAVNVGTRQINGYIAKRQSEGAMNATINRELSLLQRAFTLGYESEPRTVAHPIRFSRLAESKPRAGFIEQKQYDALTANCSDLFMRTMLALAYSFGFRKSELLTLKVSDVDLFSNTVQLRDSKNGEPRKVSLTQETRKLLTACITGKGPEDAAFTRGTKAVSDFRGTWAALCCRAGLGQMVCKGCSKPVEKGKCESCPGRKRFKYIGVLFHDQRRSAARNLVRAGVPETVAMKITGHKTRNVFDRYNITSERDLVDAAKKIESAASIHRMLIVEAEKKAEAGKEKTASVYNQ